MKDEYWIPQQRKALFPREILQPLYERFMHFESTSENPTVDSFLFFLLKQSIDEKDARDFAISKGEVLERFSKEFWKRFKHNDLYIKCQELLIRDADPYSIIEKLIEINDEQRQRIYELVQLMPPQHKQP